MPVDPAVQAFRVDQSALESLVAAAAVDADAAAPSLVNRLQTSKHLLPHAAQTALTLPVLLVLLALLELLLELLLLLVLFLLHLIPK